MWILNSTEPNFFERIWNAIVNFFGMVGSSIDQFLKDTFNLDGWLLDLYSRYFEPLSEILKILIILLLAVIIILGTFELIKKVFKLFIVITIILVVIYFISR